MFKCMHTGRHCTGVGGGGGRFETGMESNANLCGQACDFVHVSGGKVCVRVLECFEIMHLLLLRQPAPESALGQIQPWGLGTV